MTFIFGEGGWVWWNGTLAVTFLMLLGVAIDSWRTPQGPSGGPIIAFIVYCLAWLLMLVISTVDVLFWGGAVKHGWGMRIVFVLAAWVAVGLLWTFLFWATDPNYPDRLLPGRIIFTAHCALLYAINLWMIDVARS